jgi:hypothetical protein
MDYLVPEKHRQDLCVKYLDIATVSLRLGMTKIEGWAMNALRVIFTESANSFREISSGWQYSTLLHLRESTRETNLDSPVCAFIQYLINKISQGIRQDQSQGSPVLLKSLVLSQIYQGLKSSRNDDALLGCVFLNILALGHRSQVWSDFTGNDRAIFYAAQAQLIDLPHEFAPGSLAWVSRPVPTLAEGVLCTGCRRSLSSLWRRIFVECGEGLGSEQPLKDVIVLAEMPEYRRALWSRMSRAHLSMCNKASESRAPPSPFTVSQPTTCSIGPLLDHIDQQIRDIYVQAADRYRAIARQVANIPWYCERKLIIGFIPKGILSRYAWLKYK